MLDNISLKLDPYSDYRYFDGEEHNPYPAESPKAFWWRFEKDYHERLEAGEIQDPFKEYLNGYLRKQVEDAGGTFEQRMNNYLGR